MSPKTDSIQLSELRIQAFRGIANERCVSFGDAPVTILYGENHAGKSSVLNALDWILFSKRCFQGPLVTDRLRERVSWEIRNRHAPPSLATSCTAILSNATGSCRLTRTLSGTRARSSADLYVVGFNGEKLTGERAEQFLVTEICPSFRDFMSTVYLHQEVIRDVLTVKPEERGDAIDRLLGLSPLRDLARVLKDAKLSRFCQNLDHDFRGFEDQLEAVRRDRQRRIDELEPEAAQHQLSRENLNFGHGSFLAKEALEKLKTIASAAGLTDPTVRLPGDEKALERYATDLQTALDEAQTDLPDVKRLTELTERESGLMTVGSAYSQRLQARDEARKKLTDFAQEKGRRERLESDRADVAKQHKDKSLKLRQHDARGATVRDAIQYMEALPSPSQATKCPVCGERVKGEDLLAHLKREAAERLDARSQELSSQIKGLSQQTLQIDQTLKNLDRLEGDQKTTEDEVIGHRAHVEKVLETTLTADDDPKPLLERKLTELTAEMDKRKKAAESRQAELKDVKDRYLGAIRLIVKVLNERQSLKQLGKIQERDEFKSLRELQAHAASLKAEIEAIGAAAAAVSQRAAKHAVARAAQQIQDVFVTIADHPEHRTVQLLVGEKSVGGILRNEYSITDSEGRTLVSVLSQGDMNALALGLFVGLGLAADSAPLGFLIFDDPTQSLGGPQKERLAEVLNHVAASRQLIVATMDAEFLQALKAQITKQKRVYEFSSWDTDNGPQIKLCD